MKKIFFILILFYCSMAAEKTLYLYFNLNAESDMQEYRAYVTDNIDSAQNAPYFDGMALDSSWNVNFTWLHADLLTQFPDSNVKVSIGDYQLNNKYIQAGLVAVDESGNISTVASSNVYFKEDTIPPAQPMFSEIAQGVKLGE